VKLVPDAVLGGQLALDRGDVAAGGGIAPAQADDGQVCGGTGRTLAPGRDYQACEVPQCGQATEVVTGAWNWKPQEHA
jgi:hypothetical protein